MWCHTDSHLQSLSNGQHGPLLLRSMGSEKATKALYKGLKRLKSPLIGPPHRLSSRSIRSAIFVHSTCMYMKYIYQNSQIPCLHFLLFSMRMGKGWDLMTNLGIKKIKKEDSPSFFLLLPFLLSSFRLSFLLFPSSFFLLPSSCIPPPSSYLLPPSFFLYPPSSIQKNLDTILCCSYFYLFIHFFLYIYIFIY